MASAFAVAGPCGLVHRSSSVRSSRQPAGLRQQRGSLLAARAASFNEGAAQVRRLVDRDRKELSLDELEATFAEEAVPGASAPSAPASAAEADGSPVAAPTAAPPAARSPFQAVSSASGVLGRPSATTDARCSHHASQCPLMQSLVY